MVNRGHIGRSRPGTAWHLWFVGLVIAVVGATAVSDAWHLEHDADPSCVVCKLVHQPLAELSGNVQVGPSAAPELATRASTTRWIPADPDAQVPARAPPLS